MRLVSLALCSGFFLCIQATRLREIHFHTSHVDGLHRTNAVQYCKDMKMSLVTLYDEGDADFTQNVSLHTFWLGLHLNLDQRNISSWSNNEPVIFTRSNVTQLDEDDQRCVAINNASWINRDCSKRLAFMCYKGNSSYNISYKLIENDKTWCQAKLFCQRHYDDLVSINSEEQNQNVIKEGRGKTFWIGLIHDRWKWENNDCSAYRNWEKPRGLPESTNYTVQPAGSKKIGKRDDSSRHHTICSKGKVRIIRKHRNATWEQAYNHCNSHHKSLLWIENEEDQAAVQKWLQHPPSDQYFWIGLRQSRVFGFWFWISNRMVSYSNWENNTEPKQPLSHQCGAISGQTSNWTDKNCLLQLPFLCEEDIS